MSASNLDHFAPVRDFRIERNKVYPLPEILLLVVSGVLSGADGWEAIEQFGHAKLDWLRRFAPFSEGIPSHDCIAYVISGLSPEGVPRVLRELDAGCVGGNRRRVGRGRRQDGARLARSPPR